MAPAVISKERHRATRGHSALLLLFLVVLGVSGSFVPGFAREALRFDTGPRLQRRATQVEEVTETEVKVDPVEKLCAKLPLLTGRKNHTEESLDFKVLGSKVGTSVELTLPPLQYWQYMRGKGKTLRKRELPKFQSNADSLVTAKEQAAEAALSSLFRIVDTRLSSSNNQAFARVMAGIFNDGVEIAQIRFPAIDETQRSPGNFLYALAYLARQPSAEPPKRILTACHLRRLRDRPDWLQGFVQQKQRLVMPQNTSILSVSADTQPNNQALREKGAVKLQLAGTKSADQALLALRDLNLQYSHRFCSYFMHGTFQNATGLEVHVARRCRVQRSLAKDPISVRKWRWSYKEHALIFVDRMFAYDLGPVLFKPAEAKKHPFRLDREGALAYYRGMDENYPEDTGFALRPWVRYDLENSAVILQEKTAFAMGNYLFEDADGGTTEAQYTFGYVKDEEGALRIHVFMASIPADGEDLKFAQEPGEANLTEMTMEAAQLTWAKKLVEVGNRYVMKGDYHEVAEELVDECYAFSLRPTLFKPAEARLSPFRTSRAGAVSYFAGGDKNFPEDWGFALRPWKSARLSTEAAVIHGTQGLVMGHAYFDDALGIQRKAEFAMGFVKSSQGVRINLHHTHFPNYTEIRRMQQAPPRALEQYQVLEAQKEWGNGIVELGKYGRKVLELEERDEVEHFVGVHQEHDVNRSVLWRRAADFVDKLYAFTEGPVMLKVTEASPGTRFRTTRLGAVSWLIGGNPDFPADRGFALRPWNQVRFDNAKISIRGDKAQAIGSIALLDDPGNERQLEYVFCYARDLDGRLRIEVAHLALPYGASYRSMWDNIAGEATGAAGAVKYAAKGVAGAVHGAVGLASQGGTGLWVLLASVGVTAAFVYYFVCAWGAKPGASQGSFMSNAGAFPSYPPQGWPAGGDGFGQSQMGQMASMGGSGYRASAGRTSYAQAGGLGFQGSSSYAYGNLPQRDQQVHSLKYLS